jgi:putative ABC transport system substrate-binding protein
VTRRDDISRFPGAAQHEAKRSGAPQNRGINRRAFTALAGGAAAWPLAARAQQPDMPVIGFLHSGSAAQNAERVVAFGNGLNDAGFVEGRNVAIEFRWADGHYDRLAAMAADLVGRQVAVIATPLSTPAALAAKAATATIPIVFITASDPVALGLVASLSRPGGNVTGITSLNSDLAAKRLGLLRTLVPQADNFFALINPEDPLAEPFLTDLQAAARATGITVKILRASTPAEIDAVFANLPQQPGNALLVSTNSLFYIRSEQIAALAVRHGIAASFDDRDYARAGGLMSYGADSRAEAQQAGDYVARILKGAKPADLPVMQSEKFQLVINLKTAKALNITAPPTLLAIADEVIE